MTSQENKQRLVEAAEYALPQMALYNQYITADTLIAVLEQDGYTLSNYSVLGGVFTRAAKAGIIDKSPSANRSKSHSAKTVWRSLIYAHDNCNMLTVKTDNQPLLALALIKRPGGATNWELSRVAVDYREAVRALRVNGYKIRTHRLKFASNQQSKTWLYTLRGK